MKISSSDTRAVVESAASMAEGCTLAPDELHDRLAWIRSEIAPHAIGVQRDGDALVVTLRASAEVNRRLDRLIALERDCCSGLEIEHGPTAADGTHRLVVRGLDPGSTVFAAPRRPVSGGRRLAAAIGIGSVTSLLLCCVLPVAVASVLGGAAAAPLVGLDRPSVIVVVALAAAGLSFVALGRRWHRMRREVGDASCGCPTEPGTS